MEIKSEYQKLIDTLNEVSNSIRNDAINYKINSVIYALKQLGAVPNISGNVMKFMDITTNMAKTYAAKNHDYGNSFEQSLDEFDLIASIVRLSDKMNRIKSLIKKEAQVKDESIKDTLLDMANYAIMTVMWMNKNTEV